MPNGAVSKVETMAVGEALKNVVKEVEHAYKSEMKGDEKSPSVLMNAVDIEMNFKNVTVSSSGKLSLSKTNTESSTMEIRLATRFIPPPQQQHKEDATPPKDDQPPPKDDQPLTDGKGLKVGKLTFNPPPENSIKTNPNGFVGDVFLAVLVKKDGKVDNVLAQSGENPTVNAAAAAAVLQWKYEPTQFNNKNIPYVHIATVTFPKRN